MVRLNRPNFSPFGVTVRPTFKLNTGRFEKNVFFFSFLETSTPFELSRDTNSYRLALPGL